MQRIDPQYIENIRLTLLPLLPLGRLHRAQIVRRIHVANLPPRRPRQLPFQILCPFGLCDILE